MDGNPTVFSVTIFSTENWPDRHLPFIEKTKTDVPADHELVFISGIYIILYQIATLNAKKRVTLHRLKFIYGTICHPSDTSG
jgi:hypothetical protein